MRMATMPRGEANLPRRDLAVAALGLDFAGGRPGTR